MQTCRLQPPIISHKRLQLSASRAGSGLAKLSRQCVGLTKLQLGIRMLGRQLWWGPQHGYRQSGIPRRGDSSLDSHRDISERARPSLSEWVPTAEAICASKNIAIFYVVFPYLTYIFVLIVHFFENFFIYYEKNN